jgi:hypothetical protein
MQTLVTIMFLLSPFFILLDHIDKVIKTKIEMTIKIIGSIPVKKILNIAFEGVNALISVC